MEVELQPDCEEDQLMSRPYQSQLEEIAVQRNTIIHLPTGSGKTFIAVRLINRFRRDLKLPWGEGGKRTFFLVNTIPLVTQQKKVISRLCAVKTVAGYSGEDRVDYWDKIKWDSELQQYQVIVMTSQILADMLMHSYIRVEDINLLIFDECHHGVEDHPMRLIMKNFEGVPLNRQPRVLGLTATLINANVAISKVEETLRGLETTFHATIATVNELGEVLNFSTNPHEILLNYKSSSPTPATEEAKKILSKIQAYILDTTLPRSIGDPNIKLELWQRDISTDPKKIVKEVAKMMTSMMKFIDEFGAYGGALTILAYVILLERLKRKALSTEEETLYESTLTHCLIAKTTLVNSMAQHSGYEKIIKHSSDKVLLLLRILKEYGPRYMGEPGALLKVNFTAKPLSAIIFTQQRFTAKILYNLLKKAIETNPTDYGFLKHDFIVGFNINPYKCTREQYYTKKASQTALLKFKNKELNCLISTSVIEEGVDIPQCLLVLRYDLPMEYRSYVQSKGRARSSNSSYVIMVNDAESDRFTKQYKTFQTTEIYIRKMLVGNTDDRNAPKQSQIQEDLYNDDDIPPYVAEFGARLSSVQAISLLNRYCSVLPHDQFTTITPMWVEEQQIDPHNAIAMRLIKIYMPIACPVKDYIAGDPMTNLRSAKRSAAMKACIKLYGEGELDSKTLLPRRYGDVDFEQPDVRACFLNWPWDEPDDDDGLPKPGTKKRVRKHERIFPTCLEGPKKPNATNKYYLHVIQMKTAFEKPTDSREKALYELLVDGRGYGLLTPQPLPKICDFPMFLTVGEVTTSLQMNYAVLQLDTKLFNFVKYFHLFLFDQVLEVAKKFTVFEGKTNCMYVVPIKPSDGYDIDWDAMRDYTEIRPVAEPSAEERRGLKVIEAEYKHHIVTPWYRCALNPTRYIVSNVLEYKCPSTQFDTGETVDDTFADYYTNKYNLEVLGDKNQPLLEVRNISTRMNCLLPRAATISSFTDKQTKMISTALNDDKPNSFLETLVPEFCIKYDYPGVLWFKAMMLPSILHRVNMLLVAYELRSEIATATKMGAPHLNPGQEWAPMVVNLQVAVRSLMSLIEEPPNDNSLSIDRINNPIDADAPRPVNVVTMKESLYRLMKKKISEEYNWDECMEPIDVERNLTTVTVMDIECYDEFVSAYMPINSLSNPVSPVKTSKAVINTAAILPPPIKLSCPIAVLSRQPSEFGPELRDLLAALTTINSHDSVNLERVETLGDSFLKFAASLYLFHKFPMLNEGQLTNIKCRLIGNRNMYYAGAKAKLGGRMKVEQFSPRKDFLVPGFFAPMEIQKIIEVKQIRPTCLIGMQFSREEALNGELTDESRSSVLQMFTAVDGILENEPVGGVQIPMQCYIRAQAVSDKSVADCVEAVIGTYLLSDGLTGGVNILEWLKILPPQDNFTSYLTKGTATVLKEDKTTLEEIHRIMNYCCEDIEQIINYKFKDPSYLLEALSHPSYIRNRITRSYERLEFLGDAILDFLITSHIFECCPDLKPGELTDLRSALVNNVTFASYVVKLGLQKFICYQLNPSLENAIMTFIDHQERREHAILEDVLYLIDEEDCQIAEYVEVPKVLSDIFESLAGAIFLDSGGDLNAVWSVYYNIMCREIQAFSLRIPQQPVRVLHEMTHACPDFGKPCIVEPSTQKVMVPVTVTKLGQQHTVYGFGGNKFQAKRAAAKLALKVLSL